LGIDATGGIKSKNEWVYKTFWDLTILDEYHFGARNDRSKNLLDIGYNESKREIEKQNYIL